MYFGRQSGTHTGATGSIRSRGRRKVAGSMPRRLAVERLEGRLLLSTVPMTLNITRLKALTNPDSGNPIGGDGDYYAEVTIGDKPEQSTANRVDNPVTVASGSTRVNPPFWSFTEFIDPAEFELGLIPVQIQMFDSDLASSDEVIDITPEEGEKSLAFLFDPVGGVLEGIAAGTEGDTAEIQFEMFVSVPLTLAITEFQQIDSPELGGGDGEFKYYVKMGDNTEQDTGSFSYPPGSFGTPGLTFTNYIKPTTTSIKIRIAVEDVDLLSGNDTMDINPRSGVTSLTLDYNTIDATWAEEGGAFAFPQNFAQGDEEDRGKIFFNIGPGPDSDGDGLYDYWESHGIDSDADGDIDLILGTNPMHKDLFVEVDAMQGLAPQAGALADVVAAFASAPNSSVHNPDGLDGINLHIQLDETNIPPATWPVGFPEFDLIKQNTNPNVAGGFGTVAERADPNAANILAAKRNVYRYSIFADQYGTNGSSGQAELNNPGQDIFGGNDFFVTLGSIGGGNRQQQSGTFMHELGHTLGLFHGGHQASESKFNRKPNYHSVMNYIWQLPRFPGLSPTPNDTAFFNSWTLDFSREEFNDLNENHLNEATGIGGHTGHVVRMESGRFVPESGPIDWDADGTGNEADVEVEINGNMSRDTLEGSEDWSRLRYAFRETRNFADGDHGSLDVDELTLAEIQEVNEALIYASEIGNGPDDLTLRRNGAKLEVWDGGILVASRALADTRLVQIIGAHSEDDTLTIDFSAGGFFAPVGGIEFLGGDGGSDLLKLIGIDGATGAYTPSATSPGSGLATVESAGQTALIAFSGLEPVEISNMASYSFVSPNSDDQLAVDFGVASGEAAYVVSGTSGGVGFESLAVFDVGTFTVDAANNDGAAPGDVVTIGPSGAAGVGAIHVLTGAGADTLSVTASEGAAISVDAGSGEDVLNVLGESLTFALTDTALTTATRAPVSYTGVETLGLYSGVFQVPALEAVSADVRVDTDGVLAGVGSVAGAVTVNADGTIGPGEDGPGTLYVSDTIFTSGSSFEVDLNGPTSGLASDELNVSGTIDLGGADLVGSLGPAIIVPGDEFVIVRKDGAPVSGEFGNQGPGDIVSIGGKKFAVDYAFDGDGDGEFNDVALIAYGAALGPDPCEPGKTALFVSATAGDDLIRFVSVAGNDQIRVLINGQDEGVFAPTSWLIGFGQAGDDVIQAEVPSRDVWLYGQGGNDRLVAGNNNAILLGGIGDDHLLGGNGSDILIGGDGADTLEGGTGMDLLVGSGTEYDSTASSNAAVNRQALCVIMDEWQRGQGGYEGRIRHLTLGGGRNGATVLSALDDGSIDRLFGGDGLDWFLAGVDDILDLRPNEKATRA